MRSAISFLAIALLLTVRLHAQSADFQYTQSCLGDQTTFMASSSFDDTAVLSWLWDLDNDGQFDDASGKIMVHLFTSSGDFTVRLEVTPSAGSAVIATETVTIDPLPEVNFVAENLCEGQTAYYRDASTIQSGSIDQFHWDFDNDGTVDDTGEEVTYICGPAQTYQTKLSCVSDKGCTAFALKTTSVHPVPSPGFVASRLCATDLANFTSQTELSGDSLSNQLWDFGDGEAANSIEDATHRYDQPGTYTVTLISIGSKGCRDSVSQPISIESLPDAEVALSSGATIYGEAGVTATVEGNDINGVTWPDGSGGTQHDFLSGGDYTVHVQFENGCQRSVDFRIDEEGISGIEIESDLITPNGDGINDALVVRNILGGESCAVLIVDRWNQTIFESDNYANDWDGSQGGKNLDAGAYFVRITCGDHDPFIGNINLLK